MNWGRNFVDAIIITIAFFAGFYLFNSLDLPSMAQSSFIVLAILFLGYLLIAFLVMSFIHFLRGEDAAPIEDRKIDRFTKKAAVSQIVAFVIAVILVFVFPPIGNFIVAQGLLLQGALLGVLEVFALIIADKWLVK